MKRLFKIMVCMVLVMVTVFAMGAPAYAATKAKKQTTYGDMYAAKVIQVKTEKATKLHFTQTKGKFEYQTWTLGTSKKDYYGDFYIYVVDESGKEAPKMYECTFKKSLTISLKANKTYTITICANPADITYNRLVKKHVLWNRSRLGDFVIWTKLPKWTVTVDKALSLSTIRSVRTPLN